MYKKSILIASIFAAMSSVSAFAAQIGEVTISGNLLLESWVDTHSERGERKLPSSEPNVFTLHNISLSGERALDGGNTFSWKLGHRNRNGDLGSSGSLGSREAWLGIEGEYGAVKFGRFLNKAWEVLDWPYGSSAWQAEALAETGAADWISVRAVRYTAPKIGGLQLEGTYDVGNASAQGRASLMEGYARYSTGPLVIDAIAQRKKNVAPQVAVGTFGPTDGGPEVTIGNNQGIYFLGARYQAGGGFELMGAIKHNYWHSDAGLASLPNFGGRPVTAGTDVHNERFLFGVNYSVGKWNINTAIEKVRQGHDSKLGGLDDAATIIGGRVIRKVGKEAWVYAGIRYTRFDGHHTPVDAFPWQVQGDGSVSKANTRVGIGAQLLF